MTVFTGNYSESGEKEEDMLQAGFELAHLNIFKDQMNDIRE